MAITDRAMQAEPTDQDQWLSDGWGRGEGQFLGRITPAGKRGFYFRYMGNNGKRDTLLLGSYDPRGTSGLTLRDARAKARQWSEIYQRTPGGKDLRQFFALQEEQRLRQIEEVRRQEELARQQSLEAERLARLERERKITVRALFERWATTDLASRVRADGTRSGRKDSGLSVREAFERRLFPRWGNTAVADMKKADFLTILDEAKASGRLRTANVLLTEMKQMLKFAATREIVDRNVLEGVTKRDVGGRETERDRVLSEAEIAQLARQLPTARMNARSEIAIWLVLATGCRIGELMTAEWQYVDMDRRVWHLPDTKNQREHNIHLSNFALSQFQKLQSMRLSDSEGKLLPWVFPNAACDGPVCVQSFGKQLSDRQRVPELRMQGRSKNTESLLLPGGKWTAHDLRRTAATLMAQLGISGDVIDECLNHVIESRVRRTYIRNRREADQVHAFDALGRALENIICINSQSEDLPH